MHVVSRKHIMDAATRFPDAATALLAWLKIAEAARWATFAELRLTFSSADYVGEFVVFNIGGNKYRLISRIKWAREKSKGHVFVRSVLTHKEYDDKTNWE